MARQGAGDVETAPCALDKGEAAGVFAREDDQDAAFHHTGNQRGDGGAPDTQHGEAQFAENQHVVEAQVHADGDDAGHHGDYRLSAFPEGIAVALGQDKGEHGEHHDPQIGQGFPAAQGDVAGVVLVQKQFDQPVSGEMEQAESDHG